MLRFWRRAGSLGLLQSAQKGLVRLCDAMLAMGRELFFRWYHKSPERMSSSVREDDYMQARKDEMTGREFYIDHNSRKTTWVRPAAAAPEPEPLASQGTPECITPVGGSPDGSCQDLAAAAASAPSFAAAAEPDAAAVSKAEEQRFGLFGLSVDEVRGYQGQYSSPRFRSCLRLGTHMCLRL